MYDNRYDHHSGPRATSAAARSPRHSPPHAAPVRTLVISGGGMKGVASLGAVVALRRAGVLDQLRTVVGTSAGALVAAAYVLGRAQAGLVDELAGDQYKPDIDLNNVRTGFGLDSGRHLEGWIRTVVGERPCTFRDVADRHGIRLVVCATNVTERKAHYFGPDTTPDMDLALALRMSCSVPLYFSAVEHEGQVFVDGAVSDNFPMKWAVRDAGGEEGVIGIVFKPRRATTVHSLESYVGALVECSTRRNYGALHPSKVLMLDTGAASAFKFDVSAPALRKLYRTGASQARSWLKKNQ